MQACFSLDSVCRSLERLPRTNVLSRTSLRDQRHQRAHNMKTMSPFRVDKIMSVMYYKIVATLFLLLPNKLSVGLGEHRLTVSFKGRPLLYAYKPA